ELVRLLQDLPQDEIEVDDPLEREPRLLALQKPLQLRDFAQVKLNHVEVILARAPPQMPLARTRWRGRRRRGPCGGRGSPGTPRDTAPRTRTRRAPPSAGRARARAAAAPRAPRAAARARS